MRGGSMAILCHSVKIWRITRPAIAISSKTPCLANNLSMNKWLITHFTTQKWPIIKVLLTWDSSRGRVTRVKSINFMTWLLLCLCYYSPRQRMTSRDLDSPKFAFNALFNPKENIYGVKNSTWLLKRFWSAWGRHRRGKNKIKNNFKNFKFQKF